MTISAQNAVCSPAITERPFFLKSSSKRFSSFWAASPKPRTATRLPFSSCTTGDPIGDILTLVQAKRYAGTRSIELEAVSALSGVVEDERANRGLLVTTSRFLPSSVSFAARQKGRVVLAEPGHHLTAERALG